MGKQGIKKNIAGGKASNYVAKNSSIKAKRRASREDIKRKVIKISYGLFHTLSDLILWEAVFFTELGSASKGRPYAFLYKAQEKYDYFDKAKIRDALYNLKRKGLLLSLALGLKEELITAEAHKRLNRILPRYDHKRIWDKRVYLVTYDIPEEQKAKRNLLYQFLKKSKCALLQRSVWISIFNPKKTIREFVQKNNIEGQIIVSDLGPDGSIGDKDLKELLAEIYNLHDLNKRYSEFCHKTSKAVSIYERKQLNFLYLSILRDDPQLPFTLLPLDWQGDKAFLLYRKIA